MNSLFNGNQMKVNENVAKRIINKIKANENYIQQ